MLLSKQAAHVASEWAEAQRRLCQAREALKAAQGELTLAADQEREAWEQVLLLRGEQG